MRASGTSKASGKRAPKRRHTVVLVEKRSQGEAVAAALGLDGMRGTWDGRPVQVTSARGHLLEFAAPDAVSEGLDWNSLENLTPIPDAPPMVPRANEGDRAAGKALQAIGKALQGADRVVVATDADREGEWIGASILAHLSYRGRVDRAWLSAGLDERSVREAFASLRPVGATAGWSCAARSRAYADWCYQYLVRAYTALARRGAYGTELMSGDATVVSVGRVQTPALALIARRERAIEEFSAVTHFSVEVRLRGVSRPFEYAPPRDRAEEPFTDRGEAEAFAARVRRTGALRVDAFDTRTARIRPPRLFNLTDAQTALATATGLSMRDAQGVFEALYEQGWLSYPRTRHRLLPRVFWEASGAETLRAVRASRAFARLGARIEREFGGADEAAREGGLPMLTDEGLEHFAIIPTTRPMAEEQLLSLAPGADRGGFGGDAMRTAWLLAAGRLLLNLLPVAEVLRLDARGRAQAAGLHSERHARFVCRGQRVLVPGWSEYAPGTVRDADIRDLASGSHVPIEDVTVVERETTAPERYTEATFLAAMERVGREVADARLKKVLRASNGIGTPATRVEIAETLVARQYVALRSGRYHLLERGRELLKVVPSRLRSPEMTAAWEEALNTMCAAEADEARALEGRFRGAQRQGVEGMIAAVIADAGEYVDRKPPPRPPSKKQLDLARSLAGESGVPEDAVRSAEACSTFIDGIDRSAAPPSDNQARLARNIAAELGAEVPAAALATRAACTEYIDAHAPDRPPTPKMVRYACRLAREANVSMPDDALQLRTACADFISSVQSNGEQRRDDR